MLTSFLEKPSPTAKSICWVNEKRTTAVGRQPRSSVILGRPGPTGSACSATENLQSWELFFSSDMIQSIVQYTNKRIRCVRRDFSEISSSLHSITKDTDEIEIRAFLGLQYLRGLAGLNNHDIANLYHPTMGPPHFNATMSKIGFSFCTPASVSTTLQQEKSGGNMIGLLPLEIYSKLSTKIARNVSYQKNLFVLMRLYTPPETK